MGVVNITPDSFSDGGLYLEKDDAIGHALRMEKEGADIIDIGGESTRPGAACISAESECVRVIPVIEALSKKLRVPISIDTRKAVVAEQALKAGAAIVNDVSGLKHDKFMAATVARYGACVILMHMKGSPEDMQADPKYEDLIGEIIGSLKESINIAKAGGIPEENIIIDPGIGFGKTVDHNIEILRRLSELKVLGRPICVGASKKSFIGKILGISDPGKRLAGTIAANAVAIMNGADILRVHNVSEALDTIKIVTKITG